MLDAVLVRLVFFVRGFTQVVPLEKKMQDDSAAPAATSHPFAVPAVGNPLPATQSLRAGRGVWRPEGSGRRKRPQSVPMVPNAATLDANGAHNQESGGPAAQPRVPAGVRLGETVLPGHEGGSVGTLQKSDEPRIEDEERVRRRPQAQRGARSFP